MPIFEYDCRACAHRFEKLVPRYDARVSCPECESTDVAKLKSHQRMFLTASLGGPDAYEGRDMRAAHAHLPITDTDFDLFLQHLAETLEELGATPERIAEVMEALNPLRVEIVAAAEDAPDEWGSQDPSGGSG